MCLWRSSGYTLWIGIFLLLKARALLGHESPAQRGCHGNWFIYLWCSKNWSGPTPRLERFNVTIDILLAGLASKLVRGKRIYWSPTKQGQTRAGICSPGKTWHTIVDQAYDGQRYRVHQVEDKVEPIVYLGIDEGAGVDDLHIVGWCTTRVLTFPFTPPPNCKRLPSHTGQEQACSRITRLFVTMPKMAQYTGKWLLPAP